VSSIRLNGFTVRLTSTASPTDFDSTSASAYASGDSGSSGSESGSSGGAVIVLAMLAVVLVVMAVAVALRWRIAKKRLVETANAHTQSNVARPSSTVGGTLSFAVSPSANGDDDYDEDKDQYLEVATVPEPNV
jgi:hypothetical protein